MDPLFHVTEHLGAWQVDGDHDGGRVQFRQYFPPGPDPRIQSLVVAGDFQAHLGEAPWTFARGLEMTRQVRPEGTFWTAVTPHAIPTGFYEYKYRVTFTDGTTRIVTDPYSRYGGRERQNAAVVVGGSRPEENVVLPLHDRKPLGDLVIYEMHIDDFTDEYRGLRAPLDAVRERLDYLASLGINAILFMPWTAWKHRDFDWGYEPFQYFAVEYRYANDLNAPAEKISWLKRLVSACHERGIHVILDGVFNHVSVDFPYKFLYRDVDECPYTGAFGGAFPGLQDLDFDHACTQDFIRDVCLYWIDTFKVDGIRFDNTVNYHRDSDAKGIPQLLEDIHAFVASRGETNFSLTLEHLNLSAARLVNDTRATSYWDNALYGHCFDALWSGQVRAGLMGALNNSRFLTTPGKRPTVYLGNHDHSHLAWQAGARDNAGAFRWYRIQPFLIALMTGPGVPMVQNGQEFGEDYWMPEDDQGTGRRVLPRPLRWKLARDPIGAALLDLHRRLITLRLDHPALRSTNFHPPRWEEWQTQFDSDGYGMDTERQIAIYHRWGHHADGRLERAMIVLNFSSEARTVTVPFPENGAWRERLNEWTADVRDYRLAITVGSHWGQLFVR